jgi:hypothetical protein
VCLTSYLWKLEHYILGGLVQAPSDLQTDIRPGFRYPSPLAWFKTVSVYGRIIVVHVSSLGDHRYTPIQSTKTNTNTWLHSMSDADMPLYTVQLVHWSPTPGMQVFRPRRHASLVRSACFSRGYRDRLYSHIQTTIARYWNVTLTHQSYMYYQCLISYSYI